MTGAYRHVEVRSAYADSVTLLQVSREVAAAPGVQAAQVAMATPLNLEVLTGMGFEVPPCSPNEMVLALRLDDEQHLAAALAAVTAALAVTGPSGGAGDAAGRQVSPRTTGSALRKAVSAAPGSTTASVTPSPSCSARRRKKSGSARR